MVYSVETVTEAFWASFFFFFDPLIFLLRKIMTDLKIYKNYITIIKFIISIDANNDHIAVLGNRYFSACDWRFIWCQFVADVKENPGGGGAWFQSQLNIDVRTLSQL